MKKVLFIKAGTPHGYGYAADEFGLVSEEDFKDKPYKDEKGNDHVKKGLQSLGVVRLATDAEYDEAIAKVEAMVQTREERQLAKELKKKAAPKSAKQPKSSKPDADPADPADPNADPADPTDPE